MPRFLLASLFLVLAFASAAQAQYRGPDPGNGPLTPGGESDPAGVLLGIAIVVGLLVFAPTRK
jgi:hypothetical protein